VQPRSGVARSKRPGSVEIAVFVSTAARRCDRGAHQIPEPTQRNLPNGGTFASTHQRWAMAQKTTDHETIRKWAEAWDGRRRGSRAPAMRRTPDSFGSTSANWLEEVTGKSSSTRSRKACLPSCTRRTWATGSITLSVGKAGVAAAHRPFGAALRDNGLTIVLTTLFVLSIAAMGWTEWKAHNAFLVEHGGAPLGLSAYLRSGGL
jgi:hypothetical protein